MVHSIFIPVDEKDWKRISRVKKKLGLTWVEFLIKSAEVLKPTIKK